MVQSNHLMFFVMGWGGRGVSCDLFGHHKELGGGEWFVSDFLCQLELTSLVCLTLSLCRSLRGGKERKMVAGLCTSWSSCANVADMWEAGAGKQGGRR